MVMEVEVPELATTPDERRLAERRITFCRRLGVRLLRGVDYFAGSRREVPERYRRQSPSTYAAQARTPLLLFEGEHSAARLHERHSAPFCAALAAASVEVEYVAIPHAGHGGPTRREEQLDYLRRILAWFDRYLRP